MTIYLRIAEQSHEGWCQKSDRKAENDREAGSGFLFFIFIGKNAIKKIEARVFRGSGGA